MQATSATPERARTRPKRPASGLRKNFRQRDARGLAYWKSKRAENTASGSGSGLYSLASGLKDKNIFGVEMGWRASDVFGSRQAQVEAIEFLYDMFGSDEGFIDGEFSKDTPPSEVLLHLCKQADGLIGSKWKLERVDGRLSCKGVRQYNLADNTFYAVPLSFLPAIRQSMPLLHDLIVGLVGALYQQKNIALWEDDEANAVDYLGQEIEENGEELDPDYLKEIKKEVESFTTGEAATYLKLIKESTLTTSQIASKLDSYRPLDEGQENLCKWIREGIVLLSSPYRLSDFIHEAYFKDHQDEYPISPMRFMRFIWQSEGAVMDNLLEMINSDAGEYGEIPLSVQISLGNARDAGKALPDFPIDLCRFLEQGASVCYKLEEKCTTKSV